MDPLGNPPGEGRGARHGAWNALPLVPYRGECEVPPTLHSAAMRRWGMLPNEERRVCVRSVNTLECFLSMI